MCSRAELRKPPIVGAGSCDPVLVFLRGSWSRRGDGARWIERWCRVREEHLGDDSLFEQPLVAQVAGPVDGVREGCDAESLSVLCLVELTPCVDVGRRPRVEVVMEAML